MKELNKVLDQNEKVLWEGCPSFWPFLLGGSVVTTFFGLVWLVFLIPAMIFGAFNLAFGSRLLGLGIILLPHFWVGLIFTFGIPLYLVLVHKYTHYAIT